MLCGDFNIPPVLSGQTGPESITLDGVFDSDPWFQQGKRRFVVTAHQPTSRSSVERRREAVSNYDHCVLSADALEEFLQARRVDPEILVLHPDDPEARLASDHFPVIAFLRTKGEAWCRTVNPASGRIAEWGTASLRTVTGEEDQHVCLYRRRPTYSGAASILVDRASFGPLRPNRPVALPPGGSQPVENPLLGLAREAVEVYGRIQH